jgi:iron complex outermembrane recepter protein
MPGWDFFSAGQVSGEKINRSLEQTQSSVVVVTEQQLRDKADHSLVDVFARTPGVYSQAGNENWGIRGVPVSGLDDQGPATLCGSCRALARLRRRRHCW